MDNYANDTIKETTIENEKSAKKTSVIITGDSLLNGINEKGLSIDNRVKIKNFPGGTTETILEEVEELVKDTPDTLIVHAETNDLTKVKIMSKKLLNRQKGFLHKQTSVFESDCSKR